MDLPLLPVDHIAAVRAEVDAKTKGRGALKGRELDLFLESMMGRVAAGDYAVAMAMGRVVKHKAFVCSRWESLFLDLIPDKDADHREAAKWLDVYAETLLAQGKGCV